MTNSQALEIMRETMMVAVKLSAPILILSMAIGVLISIIQAATQIHEQTITFVPKVAIIAAITLVTGPWMLSTMQDFVAKVFLLMQG